MADIRQAKINNLSLDLIYGLPGQTMASWEDTLHKAMSLSPEHLSCYGLKVEADTPLAHQVSLGLSLPDGDAQADLYLRAVELLQQGGYRQYEISNFAKPGRESRHNLKYWTGREYLRLRPWGTLLFRRSALCLSPGPGGIPPGHRRRRGPAGGDSAHHPAGTGPGVPDAPHAHSAGHRGMGIPPKVRPEF
ncbi:MAG: hypothetical protein ACLT9P_00965 [Evtepia gabavorous]